MISQLWVHCIPGRYTAPGCTMETVAVWYSSRKPCVMPSMWILLWHVPPTSASLQTLITTFHWNDIAFFFQQDNAPWHKAQMVQEWFEDHNNDFVIQISYSSTQWLDKQVQSMEAPNRNLQGLKVQDTRYHAHQLQGSSGHHASIGQGCFGAKDKTT